MVEIDHPEIDAEAVLARVRAVSARTVHHITAPRVPGAANGNTGTTVTAPAPATPVPVSPELERHLEAARRSWTVGEKLPPMSRRQGLVRKVAEPAARAVLRVAQLITRDQREFNHAALGALEELKALVVAQQAELAALRAEVAAGASRQRAVEYLAMLRDTGRGMQEAAPVLDVGSGREWVELLKAHGFHVWRVSAGVLPGLSAGCAGAVTAVGGVDHLVPGQLQAMAVEAARLLQPGGMLLCETPFPDPRALEEAGLQRPRVLPGPHDFAVIGYRP